MFRFFHKMRGQSTLEYAVLVVIIIGALLAIQTYIKRGVQGKLKSSTDDIGDQFSPNNTNYVKTTKTKSNTEQLVGIDAEGKATQGVSRSKLLTPETTNESSKTVIANVDAEDWGKKE